MKKSQFSISGIYKITNKITQKFYIGSSVKISRRWREHIKELKKGTHRSKYLQNSFNKYGLNNFTFEVIEECSKELLSDREQYYLDTLMPWNKLIGYNNETRVDRKEQTEETRLKKSLASKGHTRCRRIKPENKELPVGVILSRRKENPYCCIITRLGIKMYLGLFSSIKEASDIYNMFDSFKDEIILDKYKQYKEVQTHNKKIQKQIPKFNISRNSNKFSLEISYYDNISEKRHRKYIGLFNTEADASAEAQKLVDAVKNNIKHQFINIMDLQVTSHWGSRS